MLILLLKILLLVLVIRYIIRWVSYHWHHRNKKTRVFHGNCRMPFDVEFALMYGLKPKTKFRYRDLSHRKSLVEWMCILNSLYPPDKLTITRPSHYNLKSPSRDLGVKHGNNNFIRIKKIYNVIMAKPCAKNNKVVSVFYP